MCQKTTNFIERANRVHDNKYDYSATIYTRSKDKVCVTCLVHGDFFVLPGNHVGRKSGCPECAKLMYGLYKKVKAKQTFVEDCMKIHGNKYDYSKVEYVLSHDKVKIGCPIHGEFEMVAYTHRQGGNCQRCAKESAGSKLSLTQEQFIERAVNIHGDKYVYDYVDYVRNDIKVQIVCKKHGPFFQRPGQHINSGEGCPECGRYSWFAEQGGYSQQMFDRNPTIKKEPGILYLVEFSSDVEQFYKIGITKNALKTRFHWGYGGYNMRIIGEYSTTLYNAWSVEQELISRLKQDRYVPHIKIGGYTECLSKYLDVGELEGQIQRLLKSNADCT